jgi:hypothetical protein
LATDFPAGGVMNIDDLRQLQDDIWEEAGMVRGDRWRAAYMSYKATRRLTTAEWHAVWQAVDEHKLAVKVTSDSFGFQFALQIMAGSEYPGTPSTAVLKITWDHLPSKTVKGEKYDREFEAIWEFCRPYFDTDVNRERLAVMGLDPNGSRESYRY